MIQKSLDDSGVSPVVGVTLMVAVVILLAAVIGAFVLDLGQSATDGGGGPSLGVSSSVSDGTLTVQVVTGTADSVELSVNGTVEDTATNVGPGTTLTATGITADSDISVTADTNGETTLVSSKNPIARSDASGTLVNDPTPTTFVETFDDGTHADNWTVLSGTWDESSGDLTDTSSTNDDKITRDSESAYGNWTFTHDHGGQFYGAQTFFIANDNDGDRSTIESGYYIQHKNSNANYGRSLRKINSTGNHLVADLGTYDGAAHTYEIHRYTNGTFIVYVDDIKLAEVTDSTEVDSSEYVMLQADNTGHTWLAFRIQSND